MEEQLKEQIRIVAIERQTAKQAKDIVLTARTEWERDHRMILDEVVIATERLAEVEAKLRELTLKAYAETGNKAPVPGVGVREVTKLEYDFDRAFKWAVEHKMALRLDVSAFEKIAKASFGFQQYTSILDFVMTYQEPAATIAQDLSKIA